MPATTAESLQALLGPAIAATGLELDELSITPAGRRKLLRVTVDSDRGIDLDAVADISRVISAALDDANAFGATPYVLEVSSPGVERPLTTPRHWRRATGRLVEAVPLTAPGARPAAAVVGRVRTASETSVILVVDGAERSFAYTDLARARVQVEFRRPDAAGDAAVDDIDGDLDADLDGDLLADGDDLDPAEDDDEDEDEEDGDPEDGDPENPQDDQPVPAEDADDEDRAVEDAGPAAHEREGGA